MRPLLIASLCLMASLVSTPDVSPQAVRRVENLPDRLHWWIVSTDGKQVFAFGARVLQEELPQTDVFTIDVDRNPPYSGVEIDPSTESVVNTHQIQEMFLPFRNAAYFKALWRGESVWLTRDYDFWQVVGDRIYAVPPRVRKGDDLSRWESIHVIDRETRQVLRVVEIRNPLIKAGFPKDEVEWRLKYITAMQVSPDRKLLITGHLGMIVVWSLPDLELLFHRAYDSDREVSAIECSPDGRLVYALVRARGLLVLNLQSKEFEEWSLKAGTRVPQDFGMSRQRPVDMWADWQRGEVFFALRHGDTQGAVAALDVSKRRVVRTLQLSRGACSSVCVVGNKLFAGCLDGIYVIDIDAWRKKPK
jgi:hypothetical protein